MIVELELPRDRDVQAQAASAGFSSVEDDLLALLDSDAERLAILEGLEDWRAGRTRPLEDVEAELR